VGEDEEGTIAALASHRTVTDTLIARHGGRIFGTAGDSVMAEFASGKVYPRDAVGPPTGETRTIGATAP
jgi:class 3 adenylate cyclase